MTGYTIIATRTPALRKVIDYVRGIDFYGDDHEEVKTLILVAAIFVAVDGLFYVLKTVEKLAGF